MKIDVPIKAAIRCDDGEAGTSTAVLLDPTSRVLTHVVLRERDWPHTERLIPAHLIAWTTEDEIHLLCSLAVARKQDPFVETEFVEATWIDPDYYGGTIAPPDGGAWLWPFAFPHEKVPIRHERVPKDELAMRRGAPVDARDGHVGKVEAFLVDAEDDRITHLIVRSGHLVRREVAVPIADVADISDDRIVLGLSRHAVEELPHVPYHEIPLLPGIHDVGNELFPVSPADVGIGHGDPDASHAEGAHLLAQDAEPRLKARGFTADEIVEWARRYVSVEGNGGVDEFIEWIDRHENAGTK